MYHFRYNDGIDVYLPSNPSHLWCTWRPETTIHDAAVYLRGPILGMVLRLRGVVGLHASSVCVGDAALAFVGTNRAGKSSTAAALVKFGYRLLTDDLTALYADEDVFKVPHGYPWINLWPDAAAALGYHNLPRIIPRGSVNDWWDKRYLALDAERQFQRNPVPLAAVYVLADRGAGSSRPTVSPLCPIDALLALVAETTVNYALDPATRAKELEVLGRLVRRIPVNLVEGPDDPHRIPEVCEVILHHYFNNIKGRPLCAGEADA